MSVTRTTTQYYAAYPAAVSLVTGDYNLVDKAIVCVQHRVLRILHTLYTIDTHQSGIGWVLLSPRSQYVSESVLVAELEPNGR